MFPNTDKYLLSDFTHNLKPLTPVVQTSLMPRHFIPSSPYSFLYCTSSQDSTLVNEFQLNEGEHQIQTIQSFQSIYTTWDFCNDFILMSNRNGDFLYYDFILKNQITAEKQHPGVIADIEIMHLNNHFVTCGGNVKNPITSQAEKLIKVWSINGQEGIQQKSRINTFHSKPIEYAQMINQNKCLTISTDKTIRLTDLILEQLSSVIKIDHDLTSSCQIDHHCSIFGGFTQKLPFYDLRMKKSIFTQVKIDSPLIQITCIERLTNNCLIFSNINQIYSLDLNMMKPVLLGKYDGERICQLTVLNKKQIVIGNMNKNFQVWEGS